MILDFAKWKKIYEQELSQPQAQTSTTTTVKSSITDPESVKLLKMFNTEFLPSILGNVDDLTISQYIDKLSALTTEQFNSAIQFFKNKGYDQPNDKIKKFQEDLMNSTDYKTFTTTEDKTKPFNDGIFGRATASALVKFIIKKFQMVTDKTKTIGETRGVGRGATNIQPAAKVRTSSDVKTGTGTQTIK